MKAEEALAITVASQKETKEKLAEYFPYFLRANLEAVKSEAKQGFKTTYLTYDQTTKTGDFTVDPITGDKLEKGLMLGGIEKRMMRNMLVERFKALGYSVSVQKKRYEGLTLQDDPEVQVSWGPKQ